MAFPTFDDDNIFNLLDYYGYPAANHETWPNDSPSVFLFDGLSTPSLLSPQLEPNGIADFFSAKASPLELSTLLIAPNKLDLLPTTIAPDVTSPATTIPSPITSPSSSSPSSSDFEVVPPSKLHRRGRKSGPRRGRIPHNAVEKNYRDSLNVAFQRLQKVVPSLSVIQYADASSDDFENFSRQPTKAAVLHAAVDYIRLLEQKLDTMKQESVELRGAVGRSQRLLEKIAFRDVAVGVPARTGCIPTSEV